MTNLELAKKIADMAVILDEDKANIPNGYKFSQVLHDMAKVIAGDKVNLVYNMEDEMNSYYEFEREQLIEQKAATLMNEYLNDITAFESIESGYEFLTKNAHNIQRALRNLDDAIKGKEYARDAVFTALGYIQTNLKYHCATMAEEDTGYEA